MDEERVKGEDVEEACSDTKSIGATLGINGHGGVMDGPRVIGIKVG